MRLAVSLLTVVPVRVGVVDRGAGRWAMVVAPFVGLLVGGAAAVVLVVADVAGLGPLLGAALAVGAMAVITRALHLDGLADLADGLGSGKPAADALEIMKRSDIGPFGVVALLFALLIQVAAVASADDAAVAVVVAAVAGRLALPWACRTSVPAARPGGLGALVAGTVGTGAAVAVTAAVLAAATAAGAVTGHPVRTPLAVLAGLAAALLALRHARRRLGGVTGDVLGALVEIATTTALVALAT
ncbi:adenosylcobinamide-GDP ribazoletransferase [Actinomadura flavalba]|uniref:adenosylcobinamide-GDP ribazoletransferase n=1 Tax=Actinomadura flavalba TaxID=1120938 RepID=UPI00036BB958